VARTGCLASSSGVPGAAAAQSDAPDDHWLGCLRWLGLLLSTAAPAVHLFLGPGLGALCQAAGSLVLQLLSPMLQMTTGLNPLDVSSFGEDNNSNCSIFLWTGAECLASSSGVPGAVAAQPKALDDQS